MVLGLPGRYWERAPVAFKFQLSDITLASANLTLFRRSADLDEHPLEITDLPEPPEDLTGADGYVVWSHPIATRGPILRFRGDTIRYMPRQYRRFFIDLSGSFEQYLATLSGNTRSTIRRKIRKFTEASGGTIAWREYKTPEEVLTFFPLAKRVSAKSYQERLLGIGLPSDENFIASARALSVEDGIRAYLLFLDGEPVSYLYCPVSQRVVSYDHLGYDPAYASLSPGTVLQMLALKAIFGQKQFALFDFTEGEGQHKEVFSTGNCLCGDIYVLRRRLVATSVVVSHHAVSRAAEVTGAMLHMVDLKSRLRRMIRGTSRG